MIDSYLQFNNEATVFHRSPSLVSNNDKYGMMHAPYNCDHNDNIPLNFNENATNSNDVRPSLAYNEDMTFPVSTLTEALSSYSTTPICINPESLSRYPYFQRLKEILIQEKFPAVQYQKVNNSTDHLSKTDRSNSPVLPSLPYLHDTHNKSAPNNKIKHHYPIIFGMDDLASIDEEQLSQTCLGSPLFDSLDSSEYQISLLDETPRSSVSSISPVSSLSSIASVSPSPSSPLSYSQHYNNEYVEPMSAFPFVQSSVLRSTAPTDYSAVNHPFIQNPINLASAEVTFRLLGSTELNKDDISLLAESVLTPFCSPNLLECTNLLSYPNHPTLLGITTPVSTISPPILPSQPYKGETSQKVTIPEEIYTFSNPLNVTVKEENQARSPNNDFESVSPTKHESTILSKNLGQICEINIGKDDGPKELYFEKIKANPQIFRNIEESKKKGVYRGSHCTEGFVGIRELAHHLDEQNIHRPYKCIKETCPWSILGFTKRGEWWRHVKHQHRDIKFTCHFEGCNKVFSRKDSYQRHIKGIHENVNSRFNKAGNKRRKKGSKTKCVSIKPADSEARRQDL